MCWFLKLVHGSLENGTCNSEKDGQLSFQKGYGGGGETPTLSAPSFAAPVCCLTCFLFYVESPNLRSRVKVFCSSLPHSRDLIQEALSHACMRAVKKNSECYLNPSSGNVKKPLMPYTTYRARPRNSNMRKTFERRNQQHSPD